MTFDKDMTWDDLARLAQQRSRAVINALNEAKLAQEEWNSFREGRTDAVLATYFDSGNGSRPGTTAAEVAELKKVFTSFKDVYDFCDNVASPVQGDRFADWQRFS